MEPLGTIQDTGAVKGPLFGYLGGYCIAEPIVQGPHGKARSPAESSRGFLFPKAPWNSIANTLAFKGLPYHDLEVYVYTP